MFNTIRIGIIYNLIGTYSGLVIQILITAILSRLLTPEEYGIVAIMQVFIVFVNVIINAGLGPAIIQNKKLNDEDNSVLFNFSIMLSIIVTILFGLFGLIMAKIYSNSIFIQLAWYQAISVLFFGIATVPTAVLNKNKQFKLTNFSKVFSNFAAGIVAVYFAFRHFGVYALLINSIVSAAINFFLVFSFSNIKLIKKIDFQPIKIVWDFSKNQFLFSLSNYFSSNFDNLLIGKFLGGTALANYNKSYNLLLMPNLLFSGIVGPVLQPVLSEHQENVELIKSVTYRIIHFLALFCLPLSVFLSMTSKQIIYIFYGDQWGEAVVPFSLLGLSSWTFVISTIMGTVMQSRNQISLAVRSSFITTPLLILFIFLGMMFGSLVSVSGALTIGLLVNFGITSFMLVRYSLFSSLRELFKQFINPLVLSLLIFVGLKMVGSIKQVSVFEELIINVLTSAVIWICYIYYSKEVNTIKRIIEK